MPSRRRFLTIGSTAIVAVFSGCTAPNSSDTGTPSSANTSPQTSPTTGTSSTTTTFGVFFREDLAIYNHTSEQIEVKITVTPASEDASEFTQTVVLDGESSVEIDQVDQMDGEAEVHIATEEKEARYQWEGDASDNHLGLTVDVYQDRIEIEKIVS